VDPVLEAGSAQQLNGYTYAADNPVTHEDPSGLFLPSNGGTCQYYQPGCAPVTRAPVHWGQLATNLAGGTINAFYGIVQTAAKLQAFALGGRRLALGYCRGASRRADEVIMNRYLWGRLRHQVGRTAALMLGIAVATASFVVLTGAARTTQLRTVGAVGHNYRSAYDILVRPKGSTTALERSRSLVRPKRRWRRSSPSVRAGPQPPSPHRGGSIAGMQVWRWRGTSPVPPCWPLCKRTARMG
jgi:hypothetical protein